MEGLTAYVHRTEKRLREQIQQRDAADYKLSHDVNESDKDMGSRGHWEQ